MFLKFYKFLLLALVGAYFPVHAEYLVFKKRTDGTLAVLEDAKEHARIYPTLMRYQFPANTNPADPMSKEERQQVLKNEQKFLQAKLSELGSYELVFVPTTLYELYIIDWYLDYRNRAILILDWFLEYFKKLILSRDLLNKKREEIRISPLTLAPEELKVFKKALKKQIDKLYDYGHGHAIEEFLMEQQKSLIVGFNASVAQLDTDFVGAEVEFKKTLETILEPYTKKEVSWINEYLTSFCQDPFTLDRYSLKKIETSIAVDSLALVDGVGGCKLVADHLKYAHFSVNKLMSQQLLDSYNTLEVADESKRLAPQRAHLWLRYIVRNLSDITNNPKKQTLCRFWYFYSSPEKSKKLQCLSDMVEPKRVAHDMLPYLILKNFENHTDTLSELQLVVDQCFCGFCGLGHHTFIEIVDLEYDAHEHGQALIYRGGDIFRSLSKKYFIFPICGSLSEAHSIAFGVSVFGGCFKDARSGVRGGNAFQFMCRSQLAIVVRVDKQKYAESLCMRENIIFIPPYTELAVLLLGDGETFHVRTTAWTETKKFTLGSGGAELPLHGTLLSHQDFLNRFSDFFAENTIFIRSVSCEGRLAGRFHDEELEKALIENTRNIGKDLAKEFCFKKHFGESTSEGMPRAGSSGDDALLVNGSPVSMQPDSSFYNIAQRYAGTLYQHLPLVSFCFTLLAGLKYWR